MNIETILALAVAIFASTGFWAFVSNVYMSKRKKKSVLEEAVLGLLHDKIYYLAKKHIENGKISDSEHANILMLYKPYTDMGGNGTAEKLMKEVEKLPIVDD